LIGEFALDQFVVSSPAVAGRHLFQLIDVRVL
jgi:hypothetical protein